MTLFRSCGMWVRSDSRKFEATVKYFTRNLFTLPLICKDLILNTAYAFLWVILKQVVNQKPIIKALAVCSCHLVVISVSTYLNTMIQNLLRCIKFDELQVWHSRLRTSVHEIWLVYIFPLQLMWLIGHISCNN